MKLSEELTEHRWVSVEELEKYQLVPGLREEIELVDKTIKEGRRGVWSGKYDK